MLSLSSIPPVSQTPVIRPSLVVDAARVSSPLKAIEPTTAVSKERSRADNKTPEPGTNAQVAAAARAAVPAQAAAQAVQQSSQAKAQQTQAQTQAPPDDQPPAQKTPIQQALDTQIKGLLSNVWKASARAVDFLLGRETAEQAKQAAEAASKLQADIWPVLKGDNNSKAEAASAKAASSDSSSAVLAYTSKGGTDSGVVDSRGRILDYVA